MGGNVKVDGQGSEPLNIKNRKERRNDLTRMFHSINKSADHKIWGYGMKSINDASAFSGSTAHFMGKDLDDEALGKLKKSFGDVDVMVPKEHADIVKAALQPGTKHGKFTVVGTKQLGGQVSAIVKHDDGKNHQVDFEFKDFDKDTQSPTDFAKFSQNSHIDDLKAGLKGTAHKVLLLALTGKDAKRGVVEKIKKGKSSYSGETSIRGQTFSQLYGMRDKHIPSLDADGKQKMHNGKPVYNELGSENAKYDTDLSKIHEKLFGKPGSDSDVEKMSSFMGTAKLMKKHLQPHEQRAVINEFASKLYDKRAASHMDGDPKKDNEIKVHTLRELRKHFPEHFDKLMYDTISKYRENYYDKPAEQLKESTEKRIHVVFAGGRFTGPTIEHQKLIDETLAIPADVHRIYVFGPSTINETSQRDPLTVSEKVATLRKLYPNNADCFIEGNTEHTKNPAQALAHAWHDLYLECDAVDLTIVAGDGQKGLTGKDAGGSAKTYSDMVTRLNESTYASDPTSFRMNYDNVNIVANPRGHVSGSVVREMARNVDTTDYRAVTKLQEALHSNMTYRDTKTFAEIVQRRSKVRNEYEDVIGENYEIIENAAKDLNVPVQVVENVVTHYLLSHTDTVQALNEAVESIATRLMIDENTLSVYDRNAPDTFVVLYHPEKLFYQVERVKVGQDTPIDYQPVIAARLQQGFIITAVHTDTLNPEFVRDNHKYQMRRYRRQIDD